jgi:hypothetical protein
MIDDAELIEERKLEDCCRKGSNLDVIFNGSVNEDYYPIMTARIRKLEQEKYDRYKLEKERKNQLTNRKDS